MKGSSFRRMLLALVATCSSLFLAACGVEGKYTDEGGTVQLQLDSGGKGTFSMSGQSTNCTYKVDGDKVPVTCEGLTVVFTKQSDGSLTPGPTAQFGALKKK